MRSVPRSLLPVLLCLALAGTAASALAASHARAAQKSQAEAERAELQQKLKTLKADINHTESAKDQASDALAESEQAISEARRSLRDLQTEQAGTEDKLRLLEQEQQKLSLKAEQQKTQLSDFLRRQYMRGDSDRVKLLLSGDNPNRINRDLQYMGYVSQTQAKMIEGLRASLQAVEKNTADARQAKADLDEIAEEEKQHKEALEKEKKRRGNLLSQLADKLHAQKIQADSLQKDEQRLSNLVSRLNQLIAEQTRAEQARAAQQEKLRQEKLAAEQKAQASGQLKKPAKPGTPHPLAAATTTAPARNETAAAANGNDGSAFSRLKGQLHLPVKGELIARFGSRHGDGPSWKGLFIRAAEGAEIKAIGAGRVVFAEWLRGWGNMIVVDHGGEYLSLYAYNQSVLKHVGDAVKAGDVIASAGNSGGNEESGLYFEMRHQGRTFDPLSWMIK
ncbi:MAG: peptidoglycan DD-metalloendopeptidase family protein [Burkholderiales bacterium]|nr:peptidoglycan DD-metalloendopeptidase family protein [Burkholderiales bacterium]